MRIGIPKGLLYYKYHLFAETFFTEIGAEIIVSPNTNKEILDRGVTYCVDDACLPIKVFHGHVSWLCGKCDAILVPRFMTIVKRKYVCPMFCGLNEMIKNSISGLPPLISEPVYSLDESRLYNWAVDSAKSFVISRRQLKNAFDNALSLQKKTITGYKQKSYPETVALIGHSYIVNDRFISMDLINKLNNLGIGVITSERVSSEDIEKHVRGLFKEPFWYFAQQYYGTALHLINSGTISGLIYVSAFSCGVDSVVIELIRSCIQGFPLLILKIDEHTGEAALNTRIEAFADMLKRRDTIDNNGAQNGQYLSCRQGTI